MERWWEIRVADPAHERLEDVEENVNGRCGSAFPTVRFASIMDGKSGLSLRESISARFCRCRAAIAW